ncbi:hypothetical protein [Flavivirga rizhaonensis]|uniref:Uncharacterized protein n=1 Tax=Flavivirga rizhaonensis TaxID=2559571 RepID=A0A4S1DX57_9FLAO|nr:hypothetical protein [Flavivirga rizhaonensis]TGV02092.1 hypothetical protein EM932_12990 [Flavivirga rizhaonensis]
MLSFKSIQNIFNCLALLITLVSFSGFTSVSFNYEKPQTELLVSKYKNNNSSVKQYKPFTKKAQKVVLNQYIVFSFKSLLNIHAFDFNITLKSQKKTILQFENYNNLLEQNLIAQTHTIKSKGVFI